MYFYITATAAGISGNFLSYRRRRDWNIWASAAAAAAAARGGGSHLYLYREELISRDENNYQILFDDPNIVLINVNNYDVMIRKKEEKNLKIKIKSIIYYSSLKNHFNVLAFVRG